MNQPSLASAETVRVAPGTQDGRGHGSLWGYLAGYGVATLLTIAAFLAAQTDWLTPSSATAAITVLAIAQMLVHLIFFLHISTSPDQRTNILAFVLAATVVSMIVAGSLWIMSHLDSNMMPVDPQMQMQMQR
ncbi:MAG: cytochrome o ubiquinol oxidase subunit iv [Ramlibacter sp.]|nr:cytochrome o ubiquinol oxidase subunit iv [Ramlibacter sp.]